MNHNIIKSKLLGFYIFIELAKLSVGRGTLLFSFTRFFSQKVLQVENGKPSMGVVGMQMTDDTMRRILMETSGGYECAPGDSTCIRFNCTHPDNFECYLLGRKNKSDIFLLGLFFSWTKKSRPK